MTPGRAGPAAGPIPPMRFLPRLRNRCLSRTIRAGLLGTVVAVAAWAEAADLRGRLESLAAQHGFVVEGLDWIGQEAAGNPAGSVPEQLKALLRDYNYLLVQGAHGSIETLRITSRKSSGGQGSAGSAYVETIRLGTHHQVEAAIAGPNAVAKTVRLIVDTGATTLVLPESMIPELGFAPEDLQAGVSQTASGQVPVKIGLLRSVRVGAVSADAVMVSFIADARLHGAMLLGMSFLQRFRMTIDDERNELILLAK
jgi:aspartyl protease family protein